MIENLHKKLKIILSNVIIKHCKIKYQVQKLVFDPKKYSTVQCLIINKHLAMKLGQIGNNISI